MAVLLKHPPRFAPRSPRKAVRAPASVLLPCGGAVTALVMNVSQDGFMAMVDGPIVPGTRVRIVVPELGTVEAEVRWAYDDEVGGRFEASLPEEALDEL
jgi:hypothetical protein